LVVQPSNFWPCTACVQPVRIRPAYGLLVVTGMACKQPSQAEKTRPKLSLLLSACCYPELTLFCRPVWSKDGLCWASSAGCPKLALNFLSLLQMLPLLLLPKPLLFLTCITSQMKMVCFSTLIPFFYLTFNHLLCLGLCASSTFKAPRRCAPLGWTPQPTQKAHEVHPTS
jgi:hypothetical protein